MGTRYLSLKLNASISFQPELSEQYFTLVGKTLSTVAQGNETLTPVNILKIHHLQQRTFTQYLKKYEF